ncbi:MAG TPA: hypothetical protein VGK67_15390 [Myxococcales bacterium]|jgi:transmembrane sensor
MPRDFRQALQDADRKNAEAGMPAAVDRRLRERLGLVEAPKRSFSFSWRPFAIAAAVAAIVLVTFGIHSGGHTPSHVGEFRVSQRSSDFRAESVGDEVQITSGIATLVDETEGIALTTSTTGKLRMESNGVRVVAGVFKTAVVKRKTSSNPARVLVSGGAIEVLGTQFTVDQNLAGNGGQVTLHEGSIRFVATDGRQVLMIPGQSLTWPLPPPVHPELVEGPVVVPEPPLAVDPPALQPEPAQPTAARPVAPAVRHPVTPAPQPEPEAERIEDLLQRIDMLRSRGQFDTAASELTRALQAGYSAPTRERLSFELGTIWSRSGSDPERACSHWHEHSKRFPNGRYDREIEQAARRLGCPGP